MHQVQTFVIGAAAALLIVVLVSPVLAQSPSERPSTDESVLCDARLTTQSVSPRHSLSESSPYWYDNQYALATLLGARKGTHPASGNLPGGAVIKFGIGFDKGLTSAPDNPFPCVGLFSPAMIRRPSAAVLTTELATSIVPQEREPTREAAIEQAQAEKGKDLHPYVAGKMERLLTRAEDILVNGVPRLHPFFTSAYYGGGFTLGAGYAHFVSPYNMIDVRGTYTILGYKRVEAEFTAPRLFHRRGELSVVGGWREATQAAFYGIGMNTLKAGRANFDFRQPFGSGTLTFRPTRRLLLLRGGLELSKWSQRSGEGTFPSVDAVYTPATLPGLGTTTTYVHSEGTVGFDWRTSPGYARRGGLYAVTLHDYTDRDEEFGFRQIEYEVVQHFPILREAWAISLRGEAQTTYTKSNQQIPFFLLPYLGSGHTLRGYISHRFRDQNRMLLQAEWRIMVNRFIDTAFFYDAGKVTARRADLDFNGLKSDYGFGVRFHGPFATPLRIEVARGVEGTALVISTTPIF